jgi:hypothetical protein
VIEQKRIKEIVSAGTEDDADPFAGQIARRGNAGALAGNDFRITGGFGEASYFPAQKSAPWSGRA